MGGEGDWKERRRLIRRAAGKVDPAGLALIERVSVSTLMAPSERAETALDVVGMPRPGEVLVALTGGQWSILDLIRAVLGRTGPARVRLSTWTTGIRDAETAAWLLHRGDIASLQVFTDVGFPERQPEYCRRLVEVWGLDAVIVTMTHAKVATIRAPGWDIAIASSMNLNRNSQFENADVFHLASVCDLYDRWFDDIACHGHRLGATKDEVRADFPRPDVVSSAPAGVSETRLERLERLRGKHGDRSR